MIQLKQWVEKAIKEGLPQERIEALRKYFKSKDIPKEVPINKNLHKVAELLYIPYGYLFLEPDKIQQLYIPHYLLKYRDKFYPLSLQFLIEAQNGAYSLLVEDGYEKIELPCEEVEIWRQDKPWLNFEKDEAATQKLHDYCQKLSELPTIELWSYDDI